MKVNTIQPSQQLLQVHLWTAVHLSLTSGAISTNDHGTVRVDLVGWNNAQIEWCIDLVYPLMEDQKAPDLMKAIDTQTNRDTVRRTTVQETVMPRFQIAPVASVLLADK